eukprot:scaffold136071_cov15-Tisochrysis_lutea.AAC.1
MPVSLAQYSRKCLLQVMQADKESRAIHFVNFESEGCNVASDLTISGHNQHGFIRCSNGKKHFILEINLENDK